MTEITYCVVSSFLSAIVQVTLLFLIVCLILERAWMFTKYVNMLTIYVALFLLYLKLLFNIFFWGITPLEKRCWLMTSWSESSNPCVSQVTQKPFLLTSVEIEKWLRQSTSFRRLSCESSRLSLDPKIWHGSYFYLEILVCKFLQDWKMDHLPMLRSLMRDYFNLKMFLPKFFPLGKSFITIPKVVLGLQKKLHRGGSAAWRVSKICESGY